MRLVTTADADDQASGGVGVSAVLALELDDGERVPLLTDRGWGGPRTWEDLRVVDVEATTRTVVGPDEPSDDLTPQDMQAGHWAQLEHTAREHGVTITAAELAALPHDVELTPRLRGLVGRGDGAS
jgi:hypothetical protein